MAETAQAPARTLKAAPRRVVGHGGDPYAAFQATSRFGSLDGLRCLSIVAVIWHHGPGHNLAGVLGSGFLGVDLFFAISGFLITTLLLRERDRFGTISLKNFYLRRSLRIFPLYFTILALYVLLVLLSGSHTPEAGAFLSNLPYFLTYTSNWFVGAGTGLFVFAWSLAAEEQFYSVWPWIERYVPGHRPVWIALGLVALVLALHSMPTGGAGTEMKSSLLWRIPSSIPLAICFGILVAHTLHSRRGFATAWKIFGRNWSSPAAFLFALTAIAMGAPRAIVDLAMALIVCSCIVREDHPLSGFLGLPPFVHIGMISYGMYMMHGLVYRGIHRTPVMRGQHELILFIVALAGTTALASLSFRYYEGVFLRFKDRFARVRSS